MPNYSLLEVHALFLLVSGDKFPVTNIGIASRPIGIVALIQS